MKKYSLKRGIIKVLTWAGTVTVPALIAFGLADVTVWELVEKYLKPILGTLTLGAVATFSINYLKVKLSA